MNRREFIELLLAAAGGLLSGGSFSARDWCLRNFYREFILSREYQFPFPREFVGLPRVIFLKSRLSLRKKLDPAAVFYHATESRFQPIFIVDLLTRERVDLKIVAASSPFLTPAVVEKEAKGVKGKVNFIFNLSHFEGDFIYYRVFYRKDKKFHPIMPIAAVRNPWAGRRKIVYFIADTHLFDDWYVRVKGVKDPAEAGLRGEFFKFFFLNVFCRKKLPPHLQNNPYLRNTYHLASSLSLLVKRGEIPHLIVKMGDDVGLQPYRFRRQGLGSNFRENALKVWIRERIIWSLLTPLVPVIQIIGNHDGEAGWERASTRAHGIRSRMMFFQQGGFAEGASPLQDYFSYSLGDEVVFYVLNSVGYVKNEPIKPEMWTLGRRQLKWLENALILDTKASVKFILFHHVIGGLSRNPDGSGRGGYGRGPLFTEEDYARYTSQGVNPERVEQVRITKMAEKFGVKDFLYGHDHIHFFKWIDSNMFALAVGATNEVKEEVFWAKDELGWIREYGTSDELRFLNAPLIEKMEIDLSEGRIIIETFCSSYPDPLSNLKLLSASPADMVDRKVIPI